MVYKMFVMSMFSDTWALPVLLATWERFVRAWGPKTCPVLWVPHLKSFLQQIRMPMGKSPNAWACPTWTLSSSSQVKLPVLLPHQLIFHFCISQASAHPSIANSKVPCSVDPSLISVGRGHCYFLLLPQSFCTLSTTALLTLCSRSRFMCLPPLLVSELVKGHFSSLYLAPIKCQVNIFECVHKLINNFQCSPPAKPEFCLSLINSKSFIIVIILITKILKILQ